MTKPLKHLPKALRSLVGDSTACLGHVLKDAEGFSFYNQVESVRKKMRNLQNDSESKKLASLRTSLNRLKKQSKKNQYKIARAFSLMLELTNVCENAYRTYRLKQNQSAPIKKLSQKNKITFVLTAHPTEARSEELIYIFNKMQKLLTDTLVFQSSFPEVELKYLLQLAWKLPISKSIRPSVEDEASSICETILNPKVLNQTLSLINEGSSIYFRTWVGGDKDGHPGVNENILEKSLAISRIKISEYLESLLDQLKADLLKLPEIKTDVKVKFDHIQKLLLELKHLSLKDGLKVTHFKKSMFQFLDQVEKKLNTPLPIRTQIQSLFTVFPALVLPLELRESAEFFHDPNPQRTAIYKMLTRLRKISEGYTPYAYARGLIVSMTETSTDLLKAEKMTLDASRWKNPPIVPLFEKQSAILKSKEIVNQFLKNTHSPSLSHFEVMMGYSDSAKEMGVLPSRYFIAESMKGLEKTILSKKLQPVFFHGSGGSVARGGGTVNEQLSSWPKTSLDSIKLTIQGEMIQRTFASAPIFESKIKKMENYIFQKVRELNANEKKSILNFTGQITNAYQKQVHSDSFMNMIDACTLYPYLHQLKLGSRPSKRKKNLSISSVRAIPWILCFTQNRTLFPVWWGLGSAWKQLTPTEKKYIKSAFQKSPILSSFLKSLGFTLAKVELSVFNLTLLESKLSKEKIKKHSVEFKTELRDCLSFFKSVTNNKQLLWYRPWLAESIQLRSPMIHPLNLLQMIAIQNQDEALLSETVTGIACGMMTTG